MKRALIIFILVAAMLLQVLPLAAFAEEAVTEETAAVEVIEETIEPEATEPEATEPEATEPEATEAVAPQEPAEAEVVEISAKGTFDREAVSNPLYSDSTEAVKAAQVSSSFDRDAIEAETLDAYYNIDQATSYITSCMEQRKTYFTFQMKFNYHPGPDVLGDLLLDLWYAAMEHNGIPTQGDYLYWHWQEVDPWEDSYYNEYSNGTCELYAIYYADYLTTKSQEDQVTNKVNQLINSFAFTPATTDYEKAYTIYNWVTTNIRYDTADITNHEPLAHSAYKGLIKGTCVCQGYASIIYRMYLTVGVPCRVVAGDGGGDHGWNIAQIAGKWYNLDATWDENIPSYNWAYFLNSPNNFTDHIRWDEYNTSAFHKAYPMASTNFNPSTYNGILQINGYWGYYKQGFLQKNFTGLAYYNSNYFYIENGLWNSNYTGLTYCNNGYYYIENGVWKSSYTGLAPYGNNLFYVEDGILDFTYTGLVWYNNAWTYVANSQLTQGYTGLVWFEGEWFYTVNSVIDWTFTGLVPYNGNMFYVQNNHLDWGYTGLAYLNGGWYYVENALLKPDYTGLTYFNENWFYVVDGTIDWSFTGMVPYNGNYFYVQNNLLDWSYTGLGYHNGAWYYFQNALYTTSFSGLVPFNGSLIYVKNGTVDWGYNGTVQYNGRFYTVINGVAIM